jgi:uncharacterized protein
MITELSLSPDLFARLAAGRGGAAAVAELSAAQVAKHLLLIGHLLDQWPDAGPERDAISVTLDRARSAAPDRFHEIIGAPLVGGWAAIAARALGGGRAEPADFRHLGAIAAVAAAAAGVSGTVAVPVHEGLVVLPGLGAAEVGDAESAEAVARDGRLTVRGDRATGSTTVSVPDDPTTAAPGWRPVRYLTASAAGLAIRVGLDDLHPYRHGHHVPPALRLGEAEMARWRPAFKRAWELLAGRVPGRAAELRAGLRTLVPLVRQDPRSARSATIRHAFGVFGLTLPPSAAEFAVTLVHEFQHSKLSAVLDVLPLTDPADTGRYFAPWRTDPRPLAGLLQGVYAFAGVADTWRALRGPDPAGALAETRFAEARLQVDAGLTSIERSDALTAPGRRLVAGLRTATDELLAEPVPPAVARTAGATLSRLRTAWAEQNGVPA